MRDPVDEHRPGFRRSRGDWGVAASIVLTIVICITAFIWIFLQLDPLLSDFISEADLATPTAVSEPSPEMEAADP